MPASPWTLTPQQVIDSPEFSILVFHNAYPEGKQGGLEIIQHGERIATCGDLRLEQAPGQWSPLPKVQSRALDGADCLVAVKLAFAQPEIHYTVRVWAGDSSPQGDQIELAVDLDEPLPAEWAGSVGFNLELLPTAFFGHAYFMDGACGAFPTQANGPTAINTIGMLVPQPLARGQSLVAAPDDPPRCLAIRAHQGELLLFDGRSASHNGWFVVRQELAPGAARDAVRWTITLHRESSLREPRLLLSQVGYHPDQEKIALIEMDERTARDPGALREECRLVRLRPEGEPQVVKRGYPAQPERFLRCHYARFDFSDVREPGMYQVFHGSRGAPPFKIGRDVYQNGVWQPTLETFLPVQMCHVRVEDLSRVWHGACHLDDALQAPPDHEHFDGYRQYPGLDTPYPAGAHIPNLNRGGWHDAGDYDLAAGSQASTTYQLALIREVFGLDSDQTTVLPADRLVVLHRPDGVPDVLQQVAHGVENLLGGYRAAGHSLPGIIESNLTQYTHLGDAATMTDNKIFGTEAVTADDRWAFTNHNTALEYQVAAALAAAARVLGEQFEKIAGTCLDTARRIWEFEHNHEPATRPVVYVWNNPAAAEAMAALELLISTGEAQYAGRFVALWPEIEQHFSHLGWAAARALEYIPDPAFHAQVRQAALAYREQIQAEMAQNPFRLPLGDGWLRANRPDHDPFAEDYRPPIWGIGWSLQSFAAHYYSLLRAFPDLFDREPLLRVLNYVLGCHPANSLSLVSGVGAQSLTSAYGTNRAEGSYIPGGIASGPALVRPNFIELLDPFPWLWQQKEYVIGGAASYIFLVLAAEDLLNKR